MKSSAPNDVDASMKIKRQISTLVSQNKILIQQNKQIIAQRNGNLKGFKNNLNKSLNLKDPSIILPELPIREIDKFLKIDYDLMNDAFLQNMVSE